jgi:ribosome-binding factor A
VVYYSVLGSEEEKADGAAALAASRPRIQAALGDQTRLRYTPKLEFRVDAAIDQGLRISQILSELAEETEADIASTSDDEPAAVDDGEDADAG